MTGHGRRVVIADDEMMMRQVLKAILKEGGFEVVGEVTQGDQVVSKCVLHAPDLLCLDINMPKKDGLEALKELHEQMPDLKVIIISGDASSEKVKEAITQGARGFIVKPFSPSQVVSRIEQLLGGTSDTVHKAP